MAWDLALDGKNDLTGKITNGGDEIVQRVRTRLGRFLGEWFLDESVGLPWYQWMLGAKNRDRVILLIRSEILATDGVVRIINFSPLWSSATRSLSLYFELVLTDGTVRSLTYAQTI